MTSRPLPLQRYLHNGLSAGLHGLDAEEEDIFPFFLFPFPLGNLSTGGDFFVGQADSERR